MAKMKIYYLNFFYEIHGQGDPVILINSNLGSALNWEYQVDILKKHYPFVLYDYRGQAQTEAPLNLLNNFYRLIFLFRLR